MGKNREIAKKRIKYCLEFQPKDYDSLINEANKLNFTTLSGYLRFLIKNRHKEMQLSEIMMVKDIYDRLFNGKQRK